MRRPNPGATIQGTLSTGATAGIVTMLSPDAPDKVMDFYAKNATAKGLTSKMDLGDTNGQHVVTFFQPGTKRALTTTVEAGEGGKGTKVSLAYGG